MYVLERLLIVIKSNKQKYCLCLMSRNTIPYISTKRLALETFYYSLPLFATKVRQSLNSTTTLSISSL